MSNKTHTGNIMDALRIVRMDGYQAVTTYDAMAVAVMLASLGWTSLDVDAYTVQHTDVPAWLVALVFDALADLEGRDGGLSDGGEQDGMDGTTDGTDKHVEIPP